MSRKILLSLGWVLFAIIGAGLWPYLPSWIGGKLSLGLLIFGFYMCFKVWKKKESKNEEVK